ncbi:uncharacterized protein LOC122092176 [Macadamia integrifolia]|uniref:uncharacterized protein LOC122092176 n=1 Tax=Macadamia integrifolia TaxID=60698 RepID=UPI001C4FF7FB|nr:uncharacterized protein LOC122092176 [Macadamia integrifolia]
MRNVNKACLSKLAWKIKYEDSIMSDFFRVRFVNADGSLKLSYKSSSIFPRLKKVWQFESDFKRWSVGDGKSINFWLDRRVEEKSHADGSSLDLNLFKGTNLKVADFILDHRWCFPPVTSSYLNESFGKASQIHVSGSVDVCHWTLSPSRAFSISSA